MISSNKRNPDIYHGKNKKSDFFEGWYFKFVQPRTGNTYCFIPGIFKGSHENESYSFIQVLNGNESSFKYLIFEKDKFKASTSEFNVSVDKSSFSLNKVDLNINKDNEKVFGTLYFYNIIRWPDSNINPGSMGFYNYLDFMQCYSQVCVVDGFIKGKLNINNEIIDFTDGKVYIEKNWGRSFPYSYIWIQGNSFDRRHGSVTCSIANIPLPFHLRSFTGFLIGINDKDKFYKFTSINRSKLSIKCQKQKIILESNNKDHCLKIEATYKEDAFMKLYAPCNGQMIPIARETLHGSLQVSLYNKERHMLFNDKCSYAGVEFSKNYRNLINKNRKVENSIN
ncbi:tocopherol cyclase family protein [Clostridium felsineum]|uniref:tocopherol cyclase family protein n=1 Tax=Clostridium felsineum TaxID=36839 RepID=UPI00098C1B0E|nr:tocopherol cyclase family protein [Clostridium felsineum]URZ03097.1 hypothetical protein CLAUR_031430 [Clostridium felsineum]